MCSVRPRCRPWNEGRLRQYHQRKQSGREARAGHRPRRLHAGTGARGARRPRLPLANGAAWPHRRGRRTWTGRFGPLNVHREGRSLLATNGGRRARTLSPSVGWALKYSSLVAAMVWLVWLQPAARAAPQRVTRKAQSTISVTEGAGPEGDTVIHKVNRRFDAIPRSSPRGVLLLDETIETEEAGSSGYTKAQVTLEAS